MSYPPEKNKQYLKDRYEKQRAEIIALLGGVCAVCGSPEALEVDHIDWVKKTVDVGRLWTKNTRPLLDAELEKCQLLCKDHHIQKSKSDQMEMRAAGLAGFTPFKHGTVYSFMRKKCNCIICDERKREWYDARNAARRKSGGRGPYRRKVRD